jgi:hypothetical protein
MSPKKIISKRATELGLNLQQAKSLMEMYRNLNDASRETMMRELTACTTAEEAITKLIFPFKRNKMDNEIRELIKRGQPAGLSVAGPEGYTYSIGLSVLRNPPHELVIGAGLNGNIGGKLILHLVETYPDGIYPLDTVLQSPDFYPDRFIIRKVNATNAFIQKYFARIDQWTDVFPKDIYLIHLADKNNVLPHEEGYDKSFNQIALM